MMAELPSQMTAIEIAGPGGAHMLRPIQRSVPEPKAGEVLVRIRAAGVNRPDVLQRQGHYAPPAVHPVFLGLRLPGISLRLVKVLRATRSAIRLWRCLLVVAMPNMRSYTKPTHCRSLQAMAILKPPLSPKPFSRSGIMCLSVVA